MTQPQPNLEPALVSPGKRILARVIRGAIALCLLGPGFAVSYSRLAGGYFLQSSPGPIELFFNGVFLVYCVVQIVLVLAKAKTIGSAILGFDYRDATGNPSGGKLLLQEFITDLIGVFTCGIGFVVVAVTCRPGQSFVDRWLGLYAVYPKQITTMPDAVAPPAPGRVQQVTMPGMAAAPPAQARVAPSPTESTPVAPQSAPAVPVAGVPASWLAPQAMPSAPAGPQQGEVIRSVPFAPRNLAPTPMAPPTPAQVAPPTPASQQSSPSSPPVAVTQDETVLDDAEPEMTLLRLDDGTPLVVDRPLVFGRNPVAPAEYPNARPIELVDESMKLSKSHAVALLIDGALAVVDLDALNGVHLSIAGVGSKLVPGQATPVPVGAHVRMGGRSFTVEVG